MNKVIIMGRLGADPQLNNTKSGAAVVKIRVASNERTKKGDQWVDHTEWHAVVIWGKRGEALSRILRKGSQVLVEGRLRTSSWEKDGDKRYRTEIHADDVTILAESKREGAQTNMAPQPASSMDYEADELPF